MKYYYDKRLCVGRTGFDFYCRAYFKYKDEEQEVLISKYYPDLNTKITNKIKKEFKDMVDINISKYLREHQ